MQPGSGGGCPHVPREVGKGYLLDVFLSTVESVHVLCRGVFVGCYQSCTISKLLKNICILYVVGASHNISYGVYLRTNKLAEV